MSETEQPSQRTQVALTSAQIRQFRPPVHEQGYDCGVVDEFLVLVAQQYDNALAKLGFRDLTEGERLIGETLLIAQQAAQQLRGAAERDAEAIRLEAETAAEQLKAAATAQADAQLEEAKSRVAHVEAEAAAARAAHEDEMQRLVALADVARGEMVKFLHEALGRLDAAPARPAPVAKRPPARANSSQPTDE